MFFDTIFLTFFGLVISPAFCVLDNVVHIFMVSFLHQMNLNSQLTKLLMLTSCWWMRICQPLYHKMPTHSTKHMPVHVFGLWMLNHKMCLVYLPSMRATTSRCSSFLLEVNYGHSKQLLLATQNASKASIIFHKFKNEEKFMSLF